MDPGTAISIAQVGCSVAEEVYSYIKDVKGYEEDVKRLQEELNWLYNAFTEVEKAVKYEGVSPSNQTLLKDPLLRCGTGANKLREAVEKMKRRQGKKFLYPFQKPKLQELSQHIRICHSQLGIALNLLQIETAQLSWNRLGEANTKLDTLVSAIQTAEDEKKAERIVDTLANTQGVSRRSQVEDAHESTFKWIFCDGVSSLDSSTSNGPDDSGLAHADTLPNDSHFANWLRENGEVFWVRGKAGSGKSTLMKYLVDSENTRNLLGQWAGRNKLIIVEHFFWIAGHESQRTRQGLLRSLLFQILNWNHHLVPSACKTRWESNAISALDWSIKELMEALCTIAKMPDIRICLLIDGLDECDPESEHRALVSDILRLDSFENVKTLVSSRPWTAFKRSLPLSKNAVALEDLTRTDMLGLVRDKFKISSSGQIPSDMDWKYFESKPVRDKSVRVSSTEGEARELVEDILNKADGVFLWVSIVVQNLCERLEAGNPLAVLKQYVDKFPLKLEEYFKLMLERVEKCWAREVAIILKVVMGRPSRQTSVWISWILQQRGAEFFDDPTFYLSDQSTYPISNIDTIVNEVSTFLNHCCKDLVSVQTYPHKPSWMADVRFLHRTVFDFLQTRDTLLNINKHLPEHFHDAFLLSKFELVGFKLYLGCLDIASHGNCLDAMEGCLEMVNVRGHGYMEGQATLGPQEIPIWLYREAVAEFLRFVRRAPGTLIPRSQHRPRVSLTLKEKQSIFCDDKFKRPEGLTIRDYIGSIHDYGHENTVETLRNLETELQILRPLSVAQLNHLIETLIDDESVRFSEALIDLLARLMRRELHSLAFELLSIVKGKWPGTKIWRKASLVERIPVLLIALGSDLYGAIASRDVRLDILKLLLEMAADPKRAAMWLPQSHRKYSLSREGDVDEEHKDLNADHNVVEMSESSHGSESDPHDSQWMTTWQTFLLHLIFRSSGDAKFQQPSAVEATKLLIQYGADLRTKVFVTRTFLRGEPRSIVLREPWKEGKYFSVLKVLEALLPAEDFQAIRERGPGSTTAAEHDGRHSRR